jgi:uncharacterized protein (TIGR03086 family)
VGGGKVSGMTQDDTSTTGTPADPRPLFLRAVDPAVALIAAVRPDQLGRPTPCTEYDVRALVGHLLTVLRRITHVATGGAALEVPTVTEGVPDAELAATAAADADRLKQVWADEALLDRTFSFPFGTVTGRGAVMAYAQEVVTHAWDLAAAVGRADTLDDGLAAAIEPLARGFVPAEQRGGRVPFGPVIEVPDDAGPYPRLVGWLGRDPAWTPA